MDVCLGEWRQSVDYQRRLACDVQHWRARSSAVLTGVGTVLSDDPQLNVRTPDIDMLGRQPLRLSAMLN
jgi:riboflavin biosynthesis pyrimidine reductase